METVDEQYIEEQYIKGFEIGYWLARGNEPVQKDVLNDWIKRQNPEMPYAKGLVAGKKQMEREKILEQIQAMDKAKESGIEPER